MNDDLEGSDCVFSALTASSDTRVVVGLLASLKDLENHWPFKGTHREDAALTLLSSVAGDRDNRVSIRDRGISWLVGRLILTRPDDFWKCHFDGWPGVNAKTLGLDEAALVVAIRMFQDSQHFAHLAALDAFVDSLGVDALAREVASIPATAEKRLGLLKAFGMDSRLLDLIVETLEGLVLVDYDLAHDVSLQIARRDGACGVGSISARVISPFPDHKTPSPPDRVADLFMARASERGGTVGELLRAMAEVHREMAQSPVWDMPTPNF